MRPIFAERRLIPSFRNRSVVFNALIAHRGKNVFFTQVNLEFGHNGYVGLRTIVNLNPLSRAKDPDLRKTEYDAVADKLLAHYKTVSEHIRLFDETIEWIKQPEHRFNLAATTGFNPLFIHGSRTDEEIKIEVFGRNTQDLNLGFETANKDQIADGINRLTDIRNTLVVYRDAFQTVDLGKLISQ